MLATLGDATADPATGRPLSRAEQARWLGISVRHLYRLLAAERAGVAEWAESPGAKELPYVELADGPRDRLHYRLDADPLSRLPGCPFRIGRRRGGPWLQVAHRDDRKGEEPVKPKRSPHKFRPKRPARRKNKVR
jgi:hypothetical protein